MKILTKIVFLAVFSIFLYSCEDCKFEGISPDDLSDATVDAQYAVQFRERIKNCSPERIDVWLDGGELPPGLTLYPNGELKGKISVNAEPKVYSFTIGMEVCFSGSSSSGYTNCSVLRKGFALKVKNK